MRELTERELVEGCQREDRRSQETLYGRYSRRMYAVCLRYARHQLEAQDLMQEGFIRVFDKLHAFRMEGSLEGWIRRIMVHTCINHYRKKAFQNERFGLENVPDSPVAPLAVRAVPLVPAIPPQVGLAGAIVIVGNGLTVKIAPVELAAGGHVPLITQR